MLDPKLVQDVVKIEEREQSLLKEKHGEIKKRLEILLQHKYGKLSRFQAQQFVEDMDDVVAIIDSFIEENENQANTHLREASKAVEAAKEAEFLKEGNPYYSAFKSMSSAMRHMFVSNGWRNWTFEAQRNEVLRLFDLVEQTKDTELEARKLESEKSIYDGIVKDLREELREMRIQNSRLVEQVTRLSDSVRQGRKSVEETSDSPAIEVPPARSPPEFKLSEGEHTALKLSSTPKSKAKKLIEWHKDWPDSAIAELSGLSPDGVALERKKVELGDTD